MRLSIPGLISAVLILSLAASIYAIAVGNGIRDAHTKAAMRLIGEALDDDDVDSVRNAIREYNNQGQSPYVIVELLADRESR